MKRSVFVIMALLLATPALGTVTITCTQESGDDVSAVVKIDYTVSGEAAKVRAFALDVSIDADCATISNVTNYSGGTGDKYGIFPGTIDLSDIENPVWGTPVAPSDDPGAEGTGLGTSRVILEMGSLYDPNLSGPGNNGTLCKLNITKKTSFNCHISIAVENTRGGVVLENGATAGITSPGCDVSFGEPPPACWFYSTQCHGDADGDCDVDTADWPPYRDSFLKCYGNPAYNPCADYNRDGCVDTSDWPQFRDNFLKTCATGLAQDCPSGGTWPPP